MLRAQLTPAMASGPSFLIISLNLSATRSRASSQEASRNSPFSSRISGVLSRVFGINEVVGETAFHTQPALIRLGIFDGRDLDNLAVLDMQQLLAADTAVRTGCADFLCFPGTSQSFGLLFRQRADRTDLHALAAENAFAFIIGAVAAGYNLAFRPAIALRDGPVHNQFITGLDTAPAKDAAAEIADDERDFASSVGYISLSVLFP